MFEVVRRPPAPIAEAIQQSNHWRERSDPKRATRRFIAPQLPLLKKRNQWYAKSPERSFKLCVIPTAKPEIS